MRVLLIGKEKIYRINLPNNATGTYWISDNTKEEEKKLVKIQAQNGVCEIISDRYAQIIKSKYIRIDNNEFTALKTQESIADSRILKKKMMYAICLGDSDVVNFLCCLDDNKENYKHFDISNTNRIKIGSDENNDIVYKNVLVSEEHVEIFKNEERWFITNKSPNARTFLNDIAIHDEIKPIANGDIIVIMGLILIIIDESIYIYDANDKLSLNSKIFKLSEIKNTILDTNKEEIIENKEVNINYYYKAPRMLNEIETANVKIDPPPILQSRQEKPIILTIATSMLMGITSVLFTIISLRSRKNGNSSSFENILYIFIAIITFVSMLVIPLVNIKYDKKIKSIYEKKRNQRYREYLNKKFKIIGNISDKQRKILYENYLSAKNCEKIVFKDSHRLWERKLEDEDFLSIRLGTGEIPLNIEISYPEEKFEMEDDELLDVLREMVVEFKTIKNAPIITSLSEKNITALVSNNIENIDNFMKNIILQLVTLHSYNDLKLAFFVKNSKKWEYTKMLPHIWDDFKNVRFFADNYNDMNEIAKYICEELKSRREVNDNEEDYKKTYYLIITDDYRQIEDFEFIRFLNDYEKLNFSLICMSNDLFNLPNQCEKFIVIDEEQGTIFNNINSEKNEKLFSVEKIKDIPFEKIAQKIFNIQVKLNKKNAIQISNTYSFLEMYNVGSITKLEILERWKNNDSTLSLKAPIGVDNNGKLIELDIHEKFHGPHGLIAGTTGSGKSEFIITYILSLAINYHPDDLKLLIIDYKGGGLAGAFEKDDFKLPHLVGKITNIDTNGLKRSIVSIQSELKRRQVIFNNARNMTGEGTIDIYKYQRLYHEGVIQEAIPHLVIICDEFAELKQQQPDFMEELISVSRIGRSLGIHLILATQKPSGVVNDQIRSNSKFAVCLKVQDTTDSNDIIKKPDAAYLKNAGQFYLQVGNDEYFKLGQSAWTGAFYTPSETIDKKIDTSVEFISNTGSVIKKVDDVMQYQSNTYKAGDQLTNTVKYIHKLAESQNIKQSSLWLDEIDKDIYIKDLKNKYQVKRTTNVVEAIVGEYDKPKAQEQGIVKLNFTQQNNIAVFGNAESGKESFLRTMIFDLITKYKTEQLQLYIIDFGSEALKVFKDSFHVGAIILMGEDEKLKRLFQLIQDEVKERKEILSNYNGDYELYLSKGNVMPIWTIILNNFEAFDENYTMKYGDILLTLTREALKCGIRFVITANSANGMRYRLRQNLNNKIALQLNNEEEYYSIFEKRIPNKPTSVFGRGLIVLDKEIVEFQTARICNNVDYNVYIQECIKVLNSKNTLKAKTIITLPDQLKIEDVKEQLTDISSVPIGMIKSDLSIIAYNFKENFTTIIASKNMNNAIKFQNCILEELKQLKSVKIMSLDPEQIRESSNNNLKDAFNKFATQVKEEINQDDKKYIICSIIRIDRFITDGKIDIVELNDLFKISNESERCSFIIIDNPKHLKTHVYEDWYKNYISKDSGIWIGNGISEQRLLTVNVGMFSPENKCGNDFGLIIKEKEVTLIKPIGISLSNDE